MQANTMLETQTDQAPNPTQVPTQAQEHAAVHDWTQPAPPSTPPHTKSNTELWDKLANFEFDDGPAEFTFAQRLAREHRWSLRYANRVINEYRRYLYLAATAKHPVTPSEEVDETWHMHLTYTRSYWDRFCTKILKRPLHHEPTKGGNFESTKFTDWYERTKRLYREVFHEAPPEDIWPATQVRFAKKPWELVDVRHNWIIPKGFLARTLTGATRRRKTLLSAGLLTATAAAAIGTASPLAAIPSGLPAFFVILLIIIGGGAILIIAAIVRAARRSARSVSNHDRRRHPSGCTPGYVGCSAAGPFLWSSGAASGHAGQHDSSHPAAPADSHGSDGTSDSGNSGDAGGGGSDGGSGCSGGGSGCGGGGCGGGGGGD